MLYFKKQNMKNIVSIIALMITLNSVTAAGMTLLLLNPITYIQHKGRDSILKKQDDLFKKEVAILFKDTCEENLFSHNQLKELINGNQVVVFVQRMRGFYTSWLCQYVMVLNTTTAKLLPNRSIEYSENLSQQAIPSVFLFGALYLVCMLVLFLLSINVSKYSWFRLLVAIVSMMVALIAMMLTLFENVVIGTVVGAFVGLLVAAIVAVNEAQDDYHGIRYKISIGAISMSVVMITTYLFS